MDYPNIREFSPEESVAARMALRRAIGTAAPYKNLIEFLTELSTEIRLLRDAGFSDEEIAAIIQRATGHYFPSEVLRSVGEVGIVEAHFAVG